MSEANRKAGVGLLCLHPEFDAKVDPAHFDLTVYRVRVSLWKREDRSRSIWIESKITFIPKLTRWSSFSIRQPPSMIIYPIRELPPTRWVTGLTSDRKHPWIGSPSAEYAPPLPPPCMEGLHGSRATHTTPNYPAKLCFVTIRGDSSPEGREKERKKKDKNPC